MAPCPGAMIGKIGRWENRRGWQKLEQQDERRRSGPLKNRKFTQRYKEGTAVGFHSQLRLCVGERQVPRF